MNVPWLEDGKNSPQFKLSFRAQIYPAATSKSKKRAWRNVFLNYTWACMTKYLSLLASLFACASLALAVLYGLTPAGGLPSFLPGFEVGSAHVHARHLSGLLILAVLLFALAGFLRVRAKVPLFVAVGGRKTFSLRRAFRNRIGSFLNSPSNALLRRLLSDQGAKHWKGYVFAFAMMALIAITTSLSAWIIGRIVDKIFVGRDLKAVWEITAAIVAIYTVKGAATYGQQVVLSQVANSIVADIQKRIFDQMLRMKVDAYSRSHSSEFIARQAFIAQSASSVLNLLITTFSRDALTIVGLVVVMVSQDPLLSLFALMFLPLAAVGRTQDRYSRTKDHVQ